MIMLFASQLANSICELEISVNHFGAHKVDDGHEVVVESVGPESEIKVNIFGRKVEIVGISD